MHTLADTRRCRRLLGFVPTIDLAVLVARQAAAGMPAAPVAVVDAAPVGAT